MRPNQIKANMSKKDDNDFTRKKKIKHVVQEKIPFIFLPETRMRQIVTNKLREKEKAKQVVQEKRHSFFFNFSNSSKFGTCEIFFFFLRR